MEPTMFGGILLAVVFIILFVGYVMNFFRIIRSARLGNGGMVMARVLGVVIIPLGAVLGLIKERDNHD